MRLCHPRFHYKAVRRGEISRTEGVENLDTCVLCCGRQCPAYPMLPIMILISFPGHNWNRGHTYSELKFRTMSLSETGACMYCIRQRSQSQQLCIGGTCMYFL